MEDAASNESRCTKCTKQHSSRSNQPETCIKSFRTTSIAINTKQDGGETCITYADERHWQDFEDDGELRNRTREITTFFNSRLVRRLGVIVQLYRQHMRRKRVLERASTLEMRRNLDDPAYGPLFVQSRSA
jgi:hypothetical protein